MDPLLCVCVWMKKRKKQKKKEHPKLKEKYFEEKI